MNTNTLVAALLAMTAASHSWAQPVQWRVEDGGNGHWYEGVAFPPDAAVSWQEARASALGRGGDLASLTTTLEANWVYSQVVANTHLWLGDFGPYVGLHQQPNSPEPSGGWVWVDGTPNIGVVPWYWNQPDNYAASCGGDQYACYWTGGPWFSSPQNSLADVSGSGFCCCTLDGRIPAALIEYSADCNNDGIVDFGQILSGELQDANHNGIPDGPGIATQPTDQSVGVDVPVTFIVEVGSPASCGAPVTYQWQRRNPAVIDTSAPAEWLDLVDGAGMLNTHGANFSILHPTPALATGYRCKIGGGCGCEPQTGGFIYTDTVNFSVACPADFNADGGIDFSDVEAFFERWENGC
jgi:hypothetical protein